MHPIAWFQVVIFKKILGMVSPNPSPDPFHTIFPEFRLQALCDFNLLKKIYQK